MENNGILMDIVTIAIQSGIVIAIAIFALIGLSKGQGGDDVDSEDHPSDGSGNE